MQGLNLAGHILQGLFPIASEQEPDDADDDAPSRVRDYQSSFTLLTFAQSALRTIDALSTNLPPTQVFPALRELVLQYFSSPDPSRRRGAMLALGIAVEGCSEYMTPLMSHIWPLIETGLQDADGTVRKASCVAVGCLCEWLEEQCAARHETLVPVSNSSIF